MSSSFKDYVLSGRFNKVANEAVAEAIARDKAAAQRRAAGGDAAAHTTGAQVAQTRAVTPNDSSSRLSHRKDAPEAGT